MLIKTQHTVASPCSEKLWKKLKLLPGIVPQSQGGKSVTFSTAPIPPTVSIFSSAKKMIFSRHLTANIFAKGCLLSPPALQTLVVQISLTFNRDTVHLLYKFLLTAAVSDNF